MERAARLERSAIQGEVTAMRRVFEATERFKEEQYKHLGRITEVLCRARIVSLDMITQALPVTKRTVKGLLDECVQANILLRVGDDGYMLTPHITGYFSDAYRRKTAEHCDARHRVASYVAWRMPLWIAGTRVEGVANLPEPVPGLVLDAGSSTHAVMRAMIDEAPAGHEFPNLFTINLHAAMAAVNECPAVRTPSGRLDSNHAAVLGTEAEEDILQEFPEGCATLVGTSGITPKIGLGSADINQLGTKRALCKKGLTGALIILSDHHKVFPTFSVFENTHSELRQRIEQEAHVVIDTLPEGEEEGHEHIRGNYAATLGYLAENYCNCRARENRLTVLDEQGNPLGPKAILDYLSEVTPKGTR